jgi:HEAT repeat protein
MEPESVKACRSLRTAVNQGLKGALVVMIALGAIRASAETPPITKTQPAPAAENSEQAPSSQDCCKPVPPPVAAWDVLRAEILSQKKTHRTDAIAALAVIGSRSDVLHLLEGALRDKQSTVRKTAAIALGDMQAEAAKPSLRALLDDESPDVGFAAANALWKMGDHSGREIFIATLTGERKGDGLVKSSLKSNFAKYSDPKTVAMTGVKEAAGAFLGPLPMGITIAQELMKDHGATARAACAALLAKDPSPDAVEQLTQALADKNWAVRAAAAQALAISPGKVSPQVFEPLLLDDNKSVREIAAAGIIRLMGAARPASLHWPAVLPQITAEAKHP